jgi:Bacterial PH domain
MFLQAKGMKAVSLVMAAMLFIFALSGWAGGTPESGVERFLINAPFFVAGIWFVVRGQRVGARVLPHVIVVVNPFRTRRIEWKDIERFTWGRIGIMPKVGIELSDGSLIPVFGLPVGGRGLGESSTARALNELNRQLAKHRS